MNQTPSINSTTTLNTLTTGYYSATEGRDIITATLITILFTLFTVTKGFYFTCRINGNVVEFLGEEEASSRFSLTLKPGDEVEVSIHHDENTSYSKTLTFSADELGVHATCAPAGVKYTSKQEMRTKKEIHSKHRPAA